MKTRFFLYVTVFSLVLLTTILPFSSITAYANREEDPMIVEVVLQRVYLDGEVSEEYMKETVLSMEDFWSKYEKWQLLQMTEDEVVFTQKIDDISPLLKANGYFGLSEEGILTIYNGKPENSNIIQSFFQLDLDKLESTQHNNLRKGIPIKTKDRYVKVLETFKQFTVTESLN